MVPVESESSEEFATASPRRTVSRDKLLRAARRLFVERGYHDTRPQDVAREAQVGHGTFYLHFADKRECFLAFVDQAGKELDELAHTRLEGTHGLQPEVEAVLGAIHDYADANPGVLEAALADTRVLTSGGAAHDSMMDEWGRRWAERLTGHVSGGRVHDGYDLDVIGPALSGLIKEATLRTRHDGIPRERSIRHLTNFIVQALKPQNC